MQQNQPWPLLSVIIPTYNAASHLPKLLDSLRRQTFPWKNMEIIVVDDRSTDATTAIAGQYGARIVPNGHRHIERGKALGMAAAQHDFLLFLDADNYLVQPNWVEQALLPLMADPNLTGAQSIRFYYNPQDPPANRYCSLFGINDPLAYYLKRRDRLAYHESGWPLQGTVEDHGNYLIGTFRAEHAPTLGSQGFLTRKSLLQRTAHDPYLFHLEANLELIRQGYNRYVLLKAPVGHDHVASASGFIKKCERNIKLFFIWNHLRSYRWQTPKLRFGLVILSMLTGVRPLWDALQGFIRKPDLAWFLHVYFSWIVPLVYIHETVAWHCKHFFRPPNRADT